MSATDELRRLLDERGVEHYDGTEVTLWMKDKHGYRASGGELTDGRISLHLWCTTPVQAIEATLGPKVTGDTSDGYHTFNELYYHRAVLFSVIVRMFPHRSWKSKLHHDGTMYNGMFIVGIDTDQGQATYHYDVDPYWDLFDCKELGRAPEWDGHTSDEAIKRIVTLNVFNWVGSAWDKWHKSLRHDEVKTVGDAVEQLMYESIEFGGDMGPNGNTYNGIDEGDVLTSGFINEWIERFESTLGRNKYSYKQWREISNAVGDAMEYAHNKAIECPDKADPLWNLDEYVNRILKAAFEGEVTLGRGECEYKVVPNVTMGDVSLDCFGLVCSECGHQQLDLKPPKFCPNCGARVVVE